MKTYILFLTIFLSFFICTAQTPSEQLFTKYYADFIKKYSGRSGNIPDSNTINEFRMQYKILGYGREDAEKYKYGLEQLMIFDNKDLKELCKETDIDTFIRFMKNEQLKFKAFLGKHHIYGISKEECFQSYSNLKQCIKRKDYEGAMHYWREMFHFFPKFTNAYGKGDFLIRLKIDQMHDSAYSFMQKAKQAKESNNSNLAEKFVKGQKRFLDLKELWIDTLLILYDARILYTGDDIKYGEGFSKGKKGTYLYLYRKETCLEEAYTLLKEALEIEQEKSLCYFPVHFYDSGSDLYEKKRRDADEIIENYILSVNLLNKSKMIRQKQLENCNECSEDDIEGLKTELSNIEKAIEYINKRFANFAPASCEHIIPAFQSEFDTQKNDTLWLKKVSGLLIWKACIHDEFYCDVLIQLFEINRSPNTAFQIALYYLKNEQYGPAAEYFEHAYTLEKVDETKAEYFYYAAVVDWSRNRLSNARNLALKAAELREGFGKPYILIAKMYAGSAGICGEDQFEKSTVYWVAVDALNKALSVSNDEVIKNEANELLLKYKDRFPEGGEGHMRTVYEGDPYTVKCWINRSTIVRYK